MMAKIIFTTLILSIMTSVQVFSQHMSATSDKSDGTQTGLTITDNDFKCFQELQCLKRNNPFTISNLNDFNFNNIRYETYVVNGSSRDEEVYAEYDNNGQLLRATLTQRNIKLPVSINETLMEGAFANWKVVGNELTVENFDRKRMEYKVVLQNEDLIRVVHFDRHGNMRNQFS